MNGPQSARLRPFRPIPFGRYTLLSPVASGGMGEIFLARFDGPNGFEKLCVIKKILSALAGDPLFVERFVGEAKVLVKLSHGSIAQVLDMGIHEDEPYLALEYVDGKDLRKVAARQRDRSIPLPLTFVLYVMSRVLDALAYAHRKRDEHDREINLVHRDISPQNILISYEGEVKVIDFGLAKSALSSAKTNPSLILGKFLYMSPEQARHQKVDRRSDLYAAGVCLYELISGRNPFDGVAPGDIMSRVANPQIASLQEVDPLCPQPVVDVVMKALQVDPAKRFQTAEEMRGKLLACLLEIDPSAGPESVSRYMREAFASEHQAERKLLANLNQAKTIRLSGDVDEKPATVDTAVAHLKDVAPSVAAAMGLSQVPDSPPRVPRVEGPIEPAPLSFAPTPRARDAHSDRPEGDTSPGAPLEEPTRPAVPIAPSPEQAADWEAPDSLFDGLPKVTPGPMPAITARHLSAAGVGDGRAKTTPGFAPTVEVSPEAMEPLQPAQSATPPGQAVVPGDTQPRLEVRPQIFEDTSPRLVVGKLVEERVIAKQDTQPRARMPVGRRDTVDAPAAGPEPEEQPPAEVPPAGAPRPPARAGRGGRLVLMAAGVTLLVALMAVGGLLGAGIIRVERGAKVAIVLSGLTPEDPQPAIMPAEKQRELPALAREQAEQRLDPAPVQPAVAAEQKPDPEVVQPAVAVEPSKVTVEQERGPVAEEKPTPEPELLVPLEEAPPPPPPPSKKPAAKKAPAPKQKALSAEWQKARAQFEFVTRRLPCETKQMGLLCSRFHTVADEVSNVDSEDGVDPVMKRVKELQQRLADKKKALSQ